MRQEIFVLSDQVNRVLLNEQFTYYHLLLSVLKRVLRLHNLLLDFAKVKISSSNAAIQGIPFIVGHPWTNQFDLKADILAQTKIDDSNPMVVSLSHGGSTCYYKTSLSLV